MTRSQQVQDDVSALLRARNPLLWVVTREEARAERLLVEAAAKAGYTARTWDCGQGVAGIDGVVQSRIGSTDVDATLQEINERSTRSSNTDRGVWIMRDLHPWLAGPIGIKTCRMVRNLARSLPGSTREKAQAVIVLTPSRDVPPELTGHATVIEWPLPDREEIAQILDAAIDSLAEFENDPETKKPDPNKPLREAARPKNGDRELAIDAAVGLTGEEAASCYALSLVQARRIDPARIAQEKKRIITREGVLEWFDPLPGGLDAVGGLENLKAWLMLRSKAYTKKAREYGLPSPKGALLAGLPGTGKSLTAKAVSTAWGVPLLRLDMGALKSKYVGESENNLRKAFKVVEAIGRCVLWLDEVEKALGAGMSASADGGVSADALGAILSWMQERKCEAFIIATANDVDALPPELLRKGRFDDVWWVDLPTTFERAAILATALKANKRDPAALGIDLHEIAMRCENFTGSEIAGIVPEAMFEAFADGGREIIMEDLRQAAKDVVPLTQTAATKIDKLREWARTNGARRASADEQAKASPQLRAIDM